MKAPVRLTRRRLGAALALPLAAAAKAGPHRPELQPPRERIQSAAERLMRSQAGKNIAPAFRFIP
jgi:hypothetical protein